MSRTNRKDVGVRRLSRLPFALAGGVLVFFLFPLAGVFVGAVAWPSAGFAIFVGWLLGLLFGWMWASTSWVRRERRRLERNLPEGRVWIAALKPGGPKRLSYLSAIKITDNHVEIRRREHEPVLLRAADLLGVERREGTGFLGHESIVIRTRGGATYEFEPMEPNAVLNAEEEASLMRTQLQRLRT